MEKKPSLALIPSAYKAGKVYSVLPNDGTGDFDFSRATEATRINKDGLIETVGSNIPRLNYPMIDGVVSGCPVLLLEEQSTNLVDYSDDLNLFGSSSGITISSNATTSLDGSVNADKINEDSSNGSHSLRKLSGIPTIINNEYAFSMFAKKEERSIVAISNTIGVSNSKNCFFDLENGVVLTNTFNRAYIEDWGSGWFRCVAVDVADSSNDYDVRIYTSISDGSFSHQGVTGYGLYVYGLQVEQFNCATSYIPTNGSSVTRVAETCNNAGDANTFNDSEGVLFAEISALADGGSTRRWSISDGSYSNRITLELDEASNTLKAFVISADTISYSPSEVLSDITNYNKVAIKYKQNDFALWINGFEFDVDNSGDTPINLSKMQFADGNGTDAPFYGNVKQLQYFDTALNDTDLEELTSWKSFSEMARDLLYTIQ